MGHRSPHERSGSSPSRRALSLRGGGECGFTIIEVLVVTLIIAALAAIALPAFAGQRGKAVDADAQELARNAQTAAETIAADNGGNYDTVTVDELHRYEPAIPVTTEAKPAYLSATTHGTSEYSLTVIAKGGDEFTIRRDAAGNVTRECASPVAKTGCSGGEHSTW